MAFRNFSWRNISRKCHSSFRWKCYKSFRWVY